jgi:cell division protein FtsB
MTRSRKINWIIPFAVVAAIVLGAYMAKKPWNLYTAQKSQVNEKKAELATLQADEIKRIETRSVTNDPTHLEETARKNGYRGSKERPL